MSNLADLICIFFDLIGIQLNSTHKRVFSVIIYILLRFAGISYCQTELILSELNLLSIKKCHEWSETIKDEDDICVILRDKRGNYKRNKFYEEFPELELEAKAFALEGACRKSCSFKIREIALFVNQRFKELYQDIACQLDSTFNDKLIRSEDSIRTDLMKWGAKWVKNNNRPYFEGHEREDVVKERKKFVDSMIEKKDLYYYPDYTFNETEKMINLSWISPIRKKRIIISHDESTFRSGEVSMFRWIFENMAPFFNKGRGRSIMVSMFITQHDSYDIFELDEDEWQSAITANPSLTEFDGFLNYYPRSANAWIEPKKDNYFDNEVILKQFERLLFLLKFKKAFENCEIEILVDNARTHSAKIYDVNNFNKSAGTNCIYDTIEWIENGINKRYLV
jgi:hypothetical protein